MSNKQKACPICQTSPDIQETEFGSSALTKQRRITYFSSGETLEEEDSEEEEEEEEQSSNRPPFREPAERVGYCLERNVMFDVIKWHSYHLFVSVSSFSD